MRCPRAILFVASLLAASSAFAQLTGHGIVAGTVIDAADNSPVRKAIVTLTLQTTPRTWATARTDAAGRFRFDNLPAGKYNLTAAKNQLGQATFGVEHTGEPPEAIQLADGENHDGIRLRFIPASSISGTVFDSDGQPAPNVPVQLMAYTRNLGQRVLAGRNTVVTNDRGDYHVPNVQPGEYYLAIVAMPGQPGSFAPQFYGGAEEAKDAAAIHLRASQNLDHLDFHLIAAQIRTIHGRLLGVPDPGPPPAQTPAGRARMGDPRMVQIQIMPDSEGMQPRGGMSIGAAPPSYAFSTDVPSGRYRLQAAINRPDGNLTAAATIDAHQDPGEVILSFQPSVDIRGTVRIEGPLPQPWPDITVSLSNRNQAKVAPDGTFTVKQVPPGEWAVNLNLPGHMFLKSVQFGSGEKNVRFDRIPMGGDAKGPLQIVVSTRMASIHGSVDGPADSGRTGIMLAPVGALHDFARFYYGAISDAGGAFKLEDLVPGAYRVFALQNQMPANFRNPETADRLKDLGTDIELTEGGSAEVHPKLIPTAQAREALDSELR